jgi:hypothetical protein
MTENYASSCIQAMSDSEWLTLECNMSSYVAVARTEFVNKELVFITEAETLTRA